MSAFILVISILHIFAGIAVAFTTKSAIHEIQGAISFGMGMICFALAIIIAKMDDFISSKRV